MSVYIEKVKEFVGHGATRANETYQYGSREIGKAANDLSSELQKIAARNNINSPLPADLASETDKCAKILGYFTGEHIINRSIDHPINLSFIFIIGIR